jgi:hypothetical protein
MAVKFRAVCSVGSPESKAVSGAIAQDPLGGQRHSARNPEVVERMEPVLTDGIHELVKSHDSSGL